MKRSFQSFISHNDDSLREQLYDESNHDEVEFLRNFSIIINSNNSAEASSGTPGIPLGVLVTQLYGYYSTLSPSFQWNRSKIDSLVNSLRNKGKLRCLSSTFFSVSSPSFLILSQNYETDLLNHSSLDLSIRKHFLDVIQSSTYQSRMSFSEDELVSSSSSLSISSLDLLISSRYLIKSGDSSHSYYLSHPQVS